MTQKKAGRRLAKTARSRAQAQTVESWQVKAPITSPPAERMPDRALGEVAPAEGDREEIEQALEHAFGRTYSKVA